MKRIAFLVSGGGTDMQSVLDAIDDGKINAVPVLVISSNAAAYALTRAKEHGIDAVALERKAFGDDCAARDRALLRLLQEYRVDLVVMAGYLGILSPFILDAYPKKIINIHPALLPKFGGKGFFGMNVHRAVLAAGETQSGATVHYAANEIDTGEIICQASVPVLPDDTPETLAARVLETEHKLFPEAIADLCRAE